MSIRLKRKLKPKTSKTTTNPRHTAFNKGVQQAREGYRMIFSYKTKSESKAHYKGYAEGCYRFAITNKGFAWVD